MKKKIFYFAVALVAVATVSLLAAASHPDLKLGRSIETLVNIMREIDALYVDETDPEELLEDAAAGIASGLDPYTEWMPAKEMDGFEMMTTGKYGGIGSLIRRAGDYVAIAQPYEGSPADKAGLIPGDRFLEVDGKNVVGMSTEQVTAMLKGDPGTTFTAKVLKLLTGREQTVTIRRERISIPSVPYYGMLDNGIGYIRHTDFSEGCSGDMRRALLDLHSRGELRGLVLDYRNNGGGILQEAVKVLSMFVPQGTEVVSTRGRLEQMNTVYTTEQAPIDLDTPIVVLTSSHSASAAEIVAGALQDLDRAVLMGQRTYGKGLVQMTRPVGYDSYLKITTAKYYIPSGRCIQSQPDSLAGEFATRNGRKVYDGGGVMPDVQIAPRYMGLFTAIVYGRGFIEEFCDYYVPSHPNSATLDYEEFVEWMSGKDFEYESETRRALRELKQSAERELFIDAVGEQIAAIETNLKDDKKSSLYLYREQLQELLENELIMRRGYQRAVTAHRLGSDNEVAQAVEVLSDAARYREITTSQDTERR